MPSAVLSPESASGRVPRKQGAAYTLGSVPGSVVEHAILYLSGPIFCVMQGMSPVVVGNVLSFTRLTDAVLEPWFANVSDNLRSRFGRRMPFVAFGGLFASLLFVTLFNFPRDLTAGGYAVYYGILVTLFYVAYAAFSVGYGALLPEMTHLSTERARLSGLQSTVRTAVIFMTVWALPFSQSTFFPDAVTGIHAYGWVLGLLALLGTLLVLRHVPEHRPENLSRQIKQPFRESVMQTLRIRAIYPVVTVQILLGMSVYLPQALGYYVMVYYVCGGDQKAGAMLTAVSSTTWIVSSLLLTVPLVRFVNGFGRERSLVLFGIVMMVAAAISIPCKYPGAFWVACLPTLLLAPSWNVVCVIVSAQSMDIIEWDELQGGRRREAMVMSVVSLVNKAILALAFGLATYLLLFCGFKIDQGAAQAPGVYWHMRLGMAGVPIICVLGALLAARRIKITEVRAAEIRAELERRRVLTPAAVPA